MTTTATTHHQDLPHLALFLQLSHNTEFNAKVLPTLYIRLLVMFWKTPPLTP